MSSYKPPSWGHISHEAETGRDGWAQVTRDRRPRRPQAGKSPVDVETRTILVVVTLTISYRSFQEKIYNEWFEFIGCMAHELTIGGADEPSSFAITVDGAIELVDENPASEAIIASGNAVEGAVDDTALQFQFSGDVTDITVLDGRTPVSIDGEVVDLTAFGN